MLQQLMQRFGDFFCSRLADSSSLIGLEASDFAFDVIQLLKNFSASSPTWLPWFARSS